MHHWRQYTYSSAVLLVITFAVCTRTQFEPTISNTEAQPCQDVVFDEMGIAARRCTGGLGLWAAGAKAVHSPAVPVTHTNPRPTVDSNSLVTIDMDIRQARERTKTTTVLQCCRVCSVYFSTCSHVQTILVPACQPHALCCRVATCTPLSKCPTKQVCANCRERFRETASFCAARCTNIRTQ